MKIKIKNHDAGGHRLSEAVLTIGRVTMTRSHLWIQPWVHLYLHSGLLHLRLRTRPANPWVPAWRGHIGWPRGIYWTWGGLRNCVYFGREPVGPNI